MKQETLYRWVKASERLPEKTGEYNGLYNDVEKCLITFQGGKIVRLNFSNGAQMSDGYRDFSKENIQWLEKIEHTNQEPLVNSMLLKGGNTDKEKLEWLWKELTSYLLIKQSNKNTVHNL